MAYPSKCAITYRHWLTQARRIYLNGRCVMPVRRWQAVVLVMFALGGCNANYVFDDGDYRPLGDPQSNSRGR